MRKINKTVEGRATTSYKFVAIGYVFAVIFNFLGHTTAWASAPYIASDVLGQTNINGELDYTQDGINSLKLPGSGGFNSPNDVEIDLVQHRLYVLENAGGNRVQVFNLTSSNQLVDRIPDYVLGQSQFSLNSAATAQNRLNVPFDMTLDVAGQRLFVADTFNNRVLLFDVSSLSNGQNAVNVIGQANFTSNSSATTQTGMYRPTGVAYDANNDRLFVSETNNRVLVFDVSTVSNGEAATHVLGQPDFTSSTCGAVSATSICAAYSLAYDTATDTLFVGDTTRNRVVTFDGTSISNNMSATYVIGQPDLTTSGAAVSQTGLTQPRFVTVDSAGQRLFVTDSIRIMVYDITAITDGESAINVLGQPNFTSNTSSITQSSVAPYGMAYDGSNSLLYVSNFSQQRVMIFDVASISNGENAVNQMGQVSLDGTLRWTTNYTENKFINDRGFFLPEDVIGDPDGHRLFVADTSNGRVLVFNQDSSNNLLDRKADAVLGATDFSTDPGTNTQSTMTNPSRMAYDSTRKWLYVLDSGANRVLVFDVNTITNGENALYVIGQSDFTSTGSGLSATQFDRPMDISYDSIHQRLFVVDNRNSRLLVFDMTNPSNGMAASNVIGQTDFVTDSWIDDDASVFWPEAVTYDSANNRVYFADTWDGRVLVFDMDNLANGMSASYVLGQPDFVTYDSPSSPGQKNYGAFVQGMTYDPSTGYVWMSSWDSRAVAFDANNLSTFMDATMVVGQPDFDTFNSTVSQTNMENALGMYVDPTNQRLYIADDWDNRILIFDTVHITTASLASATVGQSYAKTIAHAGSQGTTTLNIQSGSLPPGLSMNATGQITGTPTATGTYNFTVRISDSNSTAGVLRAAKQLSIVVTSAPAAPSPSKTPSPQPTDTSTTNPESSYIAPTTTTNTTPQSSSNITTQSLNDDPNYTSQEGTTKTMREGQKLTFTLDGRQSSDTETHTVTVNSVGEDYVDVTIASDPINLRLYIGEVQQVDVDGNGQNDIRVELLGIVGGKAQLLFQQISSQMAETIVDAPTSASSGSNSSSESNNGLSVVWLAVGAATILGMAVVIYVIIRARR